MTASDTYVNHKSFNLFIHYFNNKPINNKDTRLTQKDAVYFFIVRFKQVFAKSEDMKTPAQFQRSLPVVKT